MLPSRQFERAEVAPRGNHGRRRIAGRSLASAIALIIVVTHGGRDAPAADVAWEYRPYRMRVVVRSAATRYLGKEHLNRLAGLIRQRCETYAGAVWRLEVTTANTGSFSATHMRDPTPPADLTNADAEDGEKPQEELELDKHIEIEIHRDSAGANIALTAREFDVRTRAWGEPLRAHCGQVQQVATCAAELVFQVFRPLARFRRVQGEQAELSVRAGGLARRVGSPAILDEGRVLQPILRANDRRGRPIAGGIRPVPWTYLTTTTDDARTPECQVHSGLSNPLRVRGGGRIDRLALAVPKAHGATSLQIFAGGDSGQPLANCEVHARPATANSAEAELLGRTDHRGLLVISDRLGDLLTVEITRGEQLLARLPVAPGRQRRVVVRLASTPPDMRGDVLASVVRSRVLEAVAQRRVEEILFRRRLASGNIEAAAAALKRLRRLPDAREFESTIAGVQTQLAHAGGGHAQVTATLAEARKLAAEHLDPIAIRRLASQLEAARQPGG